MKITLPFSKYEIDFKDSLTGLDRIKLKDEIKKKVKMNMTMDSKQINLSQEESLEVEIQTILIYIKEIKKAEKVEPLNRDTIYKILQGDAIDYDTLLDTIEQIETKINDSKKKQ